MGYTAPVGQYGEGSSRHRCMSSGEGLLCTTDPQPLSTLARSCDTLARMTTSTDIIERLRTTASRGVSVWGDLQMEAADEIERLRKDAERLDWLSANPRMAEIATDAGTTDCYFYAVAGAPGLTLREIIDAARS